MPLRSSNASLDHQVAAQLPHLAVHRPRDAGRLAFLQAAAPLLRLATRPEQFPQVRPRRRFHA